MPRVTAGGGAVRCGRIRRARTISVTSRVGMHIEQENASSNKALGRESPSARKCPAVPAAYIYKNTTNRGPRMAPGLRSCHFRAAGPPPSRLGLVRRGFPLAAWGEGPIADIGRRRSSIRLPTPSPDVVEEGISRLQAQRFSDGPADFPERPLALRLRLRLLPHLLRCRAWPPAQTTHHPRNRLARPRNGRTGTTRVLAPVGKPKWGMCRCGCSSTSTGGPSDPQGTSALIGCAEPDPPLGRHSSPGPAPTTS